MPTVADVQRHFKLALKENSIRFVEGWIMSEHVEGPSKGQGLATLHLIASQSAYAEALRATSIVFLRSQL